MNNKNNNLIWIDMDNSPHVPFFKPIMEELRKRGYEVVITARDCFQVCGLADLLEVSYARVGKHYGKNKLLKVAGTLLRSVQLFPMMRRVKPSLAVSHGSRSQLLLAKLLGIESVLIEDYEHAQGLLGIRPTWVIMPEVISTNSRKSKFQHFLSYPGIKEDVYVPDFMPDPSVMKELKIDPRAILVTVRPPATEAHYHNPESEKLFEAVMDLPGKMVNIRLLLLPRNELQESFIRTKWSGLCETGRVIIPKHVVDGLNLIWFSDLVISGGGTMNREAAALGVPVYSIFRGKIGEVDKYLSAEGRLILLETVHDVETRIAFKKRARYGTFDNEKSRHVLIHLVNTLESILNHCSEK